MKTSDSIGLAVITVVLIAAAFCFGIKMGKEPKVPIKPIEEYLVEVIEPNWVAVYGVDIESRLVYNIALLNQIVNNQGNVLARMLADPNK